MFIVCSTRPVVCSTQANSVQYHASGVQYQDSSVQYQASSVQYLGPVLALSLNTHPVATEPHHTHLHSQPLATNITALNVSFSFF